MIKKTSDKFGQLLLLVGVVIWRDSGSAAHLIRCYIHISFMLYPVVIQGDFYVFILGFIVSLVNLLITK